MDAGAETDPDQAGLAHAEASPEDGRVRIVRLTEAGLEERALLDLRSDELARSLLAPLTQSQQERLVAAMRDVERLLTASMVEIEVVDPADPPAQYCLREYAAELDGRFPGGFDPGRSISATADELRQPRGLMLVAMLSSAPIGCGALKFHADAPTEIKRMWVVPTARGLGVARRLLTALEAHAAAAHPVVRLETNETLDEAIALYRSAGYDEVPAFNDEPYAHHWFEKHLALR